MEVFLFVALIYFILCFSLEIVANRLAKLFSNQKERHPFWQILLPSKKSLLTEKAI